MISRFPPLAIMVALTGHKGRGSDADAVNVQPRPPIE
jgi:hypothetical protein